MKRGRGFSRFFFIGLLLMAALEKFIANDRPLWCQIDGKQYFPAARSILVDNGLGVWEQPLMDIDIQKNWTTFDYNAAVLAPIPYRPGDTDWKNAAGKSPLGSQEIRSSRFRHWLGTDGAGHDVAAGLISGTRIALVTGLLSAFLAGIIGLFIGGLAGYLGDDRWRISRLKIIGNIILWPLCLFFAILPRQYWLFTEQISGEWAMAFGKMAVGIVLGNALLHLMERARPPKTRVSIPLDNILMRWTDVFSSIPKLLLIVSLAALSPANPTIRMVTVLIGILNWTGFARVIRAEMLKIRTLEYAEAAKAMGLPIWRILVFHAFPNLIRPIITLVSLSVAGAILLEASLSFLGIISGADGMTWGGLLLNYRQTPGAWWLLLFPGICITATIVALFHLGNSQKSIVSV